jgi:hypothetical protein
VQSADKVKKAYILFIFFYTDPENSKKNPDYSTGYRQDRSDTISGTGGDRSDPISGSGNDRDSNPVTFQNLFLTTKQPKHRKSDQFSFEHLVKIS